jgi:Tfp pilus assembly PilM family ATPase
MGLLGSKNSVGIYVDAQTMSILNAHVATEVKILGFSTTAGPGNLEADPSKNQPFVDNIKRVFQDAGGRPKNVLLAVPAEGSMVRYFELPALPAKEEKNAVRFEAQKYVPFEIEQLYYDYDRYPDATGKKIRIVFFACKKRWVDQISSLILVAGAKVKRVEFASQAIVRSFCYGLRKKTDQTEAIIFPNDDRYSAQLIVFKGSSVLSMRQISFTQKRDSTVPDTPFFVSEIRISFEYFLENFSNEKIAKIYLITHSEDASGQLLREAVQKELSLPVELSKFPQKIGAGQALSVGAVASYGLVLGDLAADKGKCINLRASEKGSGTVLTWEEEKKQLSDLAVKEILIIAGVLAGLFIFFSSNASSKNAELQRAFAAYPKAESASIQDSLDDLRSKETQLMEKTAYADALMDKRSYFTIKMNELAKTIPPQVLLTQMRYTDFVHSLGGSDLLLRLEGHVLSSETGSELSTINKLVERLSTNKEFMKGLAEIKIVSTKRVLFKAVPVTKFVLDCISVKRQNP